MTYQDKRGQRVSTETAYLTPEVLKRKNLTVTIRAQVTKILFESKEGEPQATAVVLTRGKGEPVYKVKAKKEVVLW